MMTPSQRRAFAEGWYRHRHNGEPSPDWRGNDDEVAIWMKAFDLGSELNISPHEALLGSVRRRAARVLWLDRVIQDILDQEITAAMEAGEPPPAAPSDLARQWLRESREEEQMLVKTSKMAIDAGLSRALQSRLALEGAVTVRAVAAALDAVDATPEQRAVAMSKIHEVLTQPQIESA
jgi:hypothetical protein